MDSQTRELLIRFLKQNKWEIERMRDKTMFKRSDVSDMFREETWIVLTWESVRSCYRRKVEWFVFIEKATKPDIPQEAITTLEEWTVTSKEEDWVHEIKYEWWEIKTKEEFLSHINFNPSEMEIISYQCNLRPVVIRVWKNETKIAHKFEHFLRCKPYTSFSIDGMLEKVEKRMSSLRYWGKTYIAPKTWKALEICIFDAHINKMTFGKEERNLDIARNVYLDMVREMCWKASMISQYEECVLVVWNDFFNSDGNSKTTAWTAQDNTANEEDAFEVGLSIIIDSVSIIKELLKCNIRIVSMPWNHARVLEQVMWTALNAIYRWDDNIVVDYRNEHRKYRNFWNSCVMFSHWEAKHDTYPMIFATEVPEIWWSTTYRECHLWHLHHQIVKEVNWVIIRHLSSVTTTDRWHDRSHFCFSIRWWQMFVWDKEKWNEAQFNFYI